MWTTVIDGGRGERERREREMDWGSESGVETEGALGSVLVFLHRYCMRLPTILDAVVPIRLKKMR